MTCALEFWVIEKTTVLRPAVMDKCGFYVARFLNAPQAPGVRSAHLAYGPFGPARGRGLGLACDDC